MIFNTKRNEDLPIDFTDTARPASATHSSSYTQSGKPRKAQARSVIDAGLIIVGTLEGDGELQIDGEVRGDIHCTHLTVGNGATVEGRIAADEVVVRGKVKGVIGGNRVILADGAHVESDIYHKKLAIEEGAHFEGAARFDERPLEKAGIKPAEEQREAAPAAEAAAGDESAVVSPAIAAAI
jgi:cytoskeletal protein CcmA (bactofilin family)